jgi:4-alpha-glucanotransferase
MRFPRASGVLVHITSLPGPHGSGDLGASAYHFVDWLNLSGQTLWQVLPLGETGSCNSPYMSSSAFAGNLLMIDLNELQVRGWLSPPDVEGTVGDTPNRVDFDQAIAYRMSRLQHAAQRFAAAATDADQKDCASFCKKNSDWLEDYALFMTLSELHEGRSWCDWPPDLAVRHPKALTDIAKQHSAQLAFWKFCQWCFSRQWLRLRNYANSKGVRIVGDLPIFIAHQSVEVWVRPDLFELNAQGRSRVVAGVPPDDFSPTGQLWGNPLYRWSAHAAENYQWWIARMRHVFKWVDIVRVDHFRGFDACWEVANGEATAINGRWVKAPGDALFAAISKALGPLPIIAEDLGVITPSVEQLRSDHGFPGMRILQFAWNDASTGESTHLPHHHKPDAVVYTGSHDNNTCDGWWQSAEEPVKHHLRDYLATDGLDISWIMIRTACASVADMAIYPMQDILRLGGEHRMNLPGSTEGNWVWRFEWNQVNAEHASQLHHLCALYDRLAKPTLTDPTVTTR